MSRGNFRRWSRSASFWRRRVSTSVRSNPSARRWRSIRNSRDPVDRREAAHRDRRAGYLTLGGTPPNSCGVLELLNASDLSENCFALSVRCLFLDIGDPHHIGRRRACRRARPATMITRSPSCGEAFAAATLQARRAISSMSLRILGDDARGRPRRWRGGGRVRSASRRGSAVPAARGRCGSGRARRGPGDDRLEVERFGDIAGGSGDGIGAGRLRPRAAHR